jgi:hypothetical protein
MTEMRGRRIPTREGMAEIFWHLIQECSKEIALVSLFESRPCLKTVSAPPCDGEFTTEEIKR